MCVCVSPIATLPSFQNSYLTMCVCVSPIATLPSFQNSYLTMCVCVSYSNPLFISKLLLRMCVSPIATLPSFQNSYLTVCVCVSYSNPLFVSKLHLATYATEVAAHTNINSWNTKSLDQSIILPLISGSQARCDWGVTHGRFFQNILTQCLSLDIQNYSRLPGNP